MVRKMAKPKEEKKLEVEEPLCAQDGNGDTEEPVNDFEVKLNKYGFIHIPKKALTSLPFESEKPLTARIDVDHLTILAATEKT